MADSFDVLEFGWYLHRHRRTVAFCCGVAVVLAFAGSLLLPKRYTGTATLVIQLPGGADPRGATAVSPVYLESLKTYEVMAASDSVFLEALDHLHLRQRYQGKSIESLKRSILKVAKPVNTRLIQISTVAEDPGTAQALAQYLAQRTVALSRSLNSQAGSESVRDAQRVFESARTRQSAAQRALETFISKVADGSTASQLESAAELSYQAARDLNQSEAELAGLMARQAAGEGSDSSSSWVKTEAASVRARVAALRAQVDLLNRTVSATGKRVEHLKALRESIDAELKSAQAGLDAARHRLDDVSAQAGARGESLEVLDPGIVPQRPSSPSVTLNALVALVASFLLCLFWLAARFGYARGLQRRQELDYLRR